MNSQNDADRALVQSIVRSPGTGWRFVGGGVWDHNSGMRLHCLGLLVMPDGTMRRATEWPAFGIAEGYIRVAGGNRKRGLMMWAMALLRIDKKVKRLNALTEPKHLIGNFCGVGTDNAANHPVAEGDSPLSKT